MAPEQNRSKFPWAAAHFHKLPAADELHDSLWDSAST